MCNRCIFEEHFEVINLRSKASTKILAFIRIVRLRIELSLFFMLNNKQDIRHTELAAANETGNDLCHVTVET